MARVQPEPFDLIAEIAKLIEPGQQVGKVLNRSEPVRVAPGQVLQSLQSM